MTGLAVLAALAGTRWSIWIKGRGGRGNTLGVAALLVLSWQAVVISSAVWIAARLLTKSSFWATRCWLLSLPVAIGLATLSWPYVLLGAALGVFYLTEHKTGTDDHTLLKKLAESVGLSDRTEAEKASQPGGNRRTEGRPAMSLNPKFFGRPRTRNLSTNWSFQVIGGDQMNTISRFWITLSILLGMALLAACATLPAQELTSAPSPPHHCQPTLFRPTDTATTNVDTPANARTPTQTADAQATADIQASHPKPRLR